MVAIESLRLPLNCEFSSPTNEIIGRNHVYPFGTEAVGMKGWVDTQSGMDCQHRIMLRGAGEGSGYGAKAGHFGHNQVWPPSLSLQFIRGLSSIIVTCSMESGSPAKAVAAWAPICALRDATSLDVGHSVVLPLLSFDLEGKT